MANFRKWMGKDDDSGEALQELTLSTMKVGYLVDHDLNTWQVIGINVYDYEGYPAREWELRCGDEVRFVCGSDDNGVASLISSEKEGRSVEELTAHYNARQLADFRGMGIEFDTSVPRRG